MSTPLGSWRLGRRFFVRTSGVPFRLVAFEGEAAAALEAGLDAWSTADARLREAALAAHAALDEAPEIRGHRRGALRRKLARRAPAPPPSGAPQALVEALEAYHGALDERRRASTSLAPRYDAARRHARARLWRGWADERVRAAVLMLSPDMARRLDAGAARGVEPKENSNTRQLERRLYLYLQRLCTKAETTSAFGPIASGWVRDHGAPLVVRHGERALRNRRTYPSGWLVHAAALKATELWGASLPLRATRDCVEVDGALYRYGALSMFERAWTPLGPAAPLKAAQQAAAGRSRAALADAGVDLELVERLTAEGALDPTPTIPRQRSDGLAALAAELRAVGEPPSPAARAFLDQLDALSALIQGFAEVPDPDRREALEAIFGHAEALVERRSYRGAGAHYADRMPFFEDCTRDLPELSLGPELVAAMAPLGAALDLWLGASAAQRVTVAEAHHRWRMAHFGELVEAGAPIPAPALLARYHRAKEAPGPEDDLLLSVHHLNLTPPIPKALQSRMASSDAPVCHVSLTDLPGRRTGEAALASCDVHLLPPAMQGERWRVVLGEGHAMVCAFKFFLDGLPDEAEFIADIDAIFDAVAGDEALLKPYDTFDAKLSYRYLSPRLTDFDPGAEGPPERAGVGWGDLRLRFADEGWLLEVREGDAWRPGRFLFKAPRELGPEHALPGVALAAKGLPDAQHPTSPRVEDGDLVLLRRRWRITTDALRALDDGPGHLRHAGFHALRGRWGLPRHLFVKSPDEPKPIWVDALDPLGVDLVLSLARRASQALVLSEMLPAPDQLWFGPDDERYVCELRLNLFCP